MFTINTVQTSTGTGAGRILAKGHGRQRTIPLDPSYSPDQNHGAAAGALLAVLTDEQQRAKILHPSGGQRVRVERVQSSTGLGSGRRWSVNV